MTSRDVARAAGVSQATVSRVMSDGAVSAAARRRVLDAMTAIGYVPHSGARSLRTGQTHDVGVVVADLANPFYPQMLAALSAELERSGYRMTVWVSSNSPNEAALTAIQERSVDGVIFTTATPGSHELQTALERGSLVTLVNRALPDVACDQVSSDNEGGGALVAEYAVTHARTRAAYIGGPAEAVTSVARLAGFSRRLAESGCPLEPSLTVEGEYRYETAYSAVSRLVEQGAEFDILFCANDLLAFGAVDALRAAGRRVPDDVWVIGYDDIPMASWGAYSLATIRQDVDATARRAVELLVARIEGRSLGEPIRVVLPPTLIVRGSARGAAGNSPGRG